MYDGIVIEKINGIGNFGQPNYNQHLSFDDIEITSTPEPATTIVGARALCNGLPAKYTYSIANPLPFTTYNFAFAGNGSLVSTTATSITINWNAGITNPQNPTNNTNAGGYVYVTTSGSNSTTKTDTLKIGECCTATAGDRSIQTIRLDETRLSSISTSTLPRILAGSSGPNDAVLLVINGTFVIDQDFEMNGGGIVLNPSAKIVLEGKNRTLTLNGVTMQACNCCNTGKVIKIDNHPKRCPYNNNIPQLRHNRGFAPLLAVARHICQRPYTKNNSKLRQHCTRRKRTQ
jgi:hypothetical protein